MATYKILSSSFSVETHGMLSTSAVRVGADTTTTAGDGNGVILTMGLGTANLGNKGHYTASLVSPQGTVLATSQGRADNSTGYQEATMIVIDNAALPAGRLTQFGDSKEQTFFNIYNHPHFTVGAKARVVCTLSGKFAAAGANCDGGTSGASFGGNGMGEIVMQFHKV